jgi:hypothetical protein
VLSGGPAVAAGTPGHGMLSAQASGMGATTPGGGFGVRLSFDASHGQQPDWESVLGVLGCPTPAGAGGGATATMGGAGAAPSPTLALASAAACAPGLSGSGSNGAAPVREGGSLPGLTAATPPGGCVLSPAAGSCTAPGSISQGENANGRLRQTAAHFDICCVDDKHAV